MPAPREIRTPTDHLTESLVILIEAAMAKNTNSTTPSMGAYRCPRLIRASPPKSGSQRTLISPLLLVQCLLLIPLVLADIEVTMDEQEPVGTIVTSLADQRSIFSSVDASQIPQMTYIILGRDSAPANYFTVEENTGVVTIAREMDREKICEARRTCQVRIFGIHVQY